MTTPTRPRGRPRGSLSGPRTNNTRFQQTLPREHYAALEVEAAQRRDLTPQDLIRELVAAHIARQSS